MHKQLAAERIRRACPACRACIASLASLACLDLAQVGLRVWQDSQSAVVFAVASMARRFLGWRSCPGRLGVQGNNKV